MLNLCCFLKHIHWQTHALRFESAIRRRYLDASFGLAYDLPLVGIGFGRLPAAVGVVRSSASQS